MLKGKIWNHGRRALVLGLFSSGLVLGPTAFAQVEEPEEVSEAEADEMGSDSAEGEEASEAETPPVPEAGTGDVQMGASGSEGAAAQPSVQETHTVAGGDTLWDLCTKYLNSPWYWPKIWSYNPHISNAHWIYPGNEIRFYPSDESLPTPVDAGKTMAIEAEEPLEQLDEDIVKNIGLPQQAGNVQAGSFIGTHVAFVSQKQHEIAGQIMNAWEEAVMLADYDEAYVKLKTAPKKGDPYAVYKTLKQIEHPITGDPYGYIVEIIGGVTVVDTSPNVATVMIRPAFKPIERGDFVGPWPETWGSRITPTPNTVEVKGYIVETLESVLTQIGEYHIVFVDRGRSHGVQVGNILTVYQKGDGYTKEFKGLPNEGIGRLMIIDVQEDSSTAMVVRSLREMHIGDKVEMKVAG